MSRRLDEDAKIYFVAHLTFINYSIITLAGLPSIQEKRDSYEAHFRARLPAAWAA